MSVYKVTICEWRAPAKQDVELENPAWEDVCHAIERLNNKEFNDVYLQPTADDSETYLAVGGGAGRYLVTGSVSNQRFPTVVDPSKPGTIREVLIVGGQRGDYPARWIVDFDTAIRAVRHFYETNRFEGGGVTWEDV